MITEQTKAIAKARLRQCISVEEIAEELEIPVKLVEEWADNLSERDMIMQEATLLAVDKLHHKSNGSGGELVPLNEDLLKNALEETAIDITKSMSIPALSGDLVHSKAIECLANAIVKMYQIIILKNGNVIKFSGSNNPSNTTLEAFAELMKD